MISLILLQVSNHSIGNKTAPHTVYGSTMYAED